jgi:hypothetical protein
MNNRSLLIQNFSKVLNIGLKTKLGKIPSSTELANQFNLRAYGTKTISRETARKWKNGLTLPEPANMQVLIEWLNLNTEQIFLIHENKPKNLQGQAYSTVQSVNAAYKLLKLQNSAQAALNHVSPRTVVLDENGIIILVNDAWRQNASNSQADDHNFACEGINYLDLCDHVLGIESAQVKLLVEGIRSVMRGDQLEFLHKYACHCLNKNRTQWFTAHVSTFLSDGYKLTVIAHIPITKQQFEETSL